MNDAFDEKPKRTKADDRRDLIAAGCAEAMRTRQGRAFVGEVLRLGGLLNMTFDASPLRMAHSEGRRSLAHDVLIMARSHASDQLPALIRETYEE